MIKRYHRHKITHSVVEHNDVLYFGGHVAQDMTVGMKAQTKQICDQFDALLADCGSDKTLLLTARLYITDMSKKDEMNEAWLEWVAGEDLPARATIGVADLGPPARLIEIVITAAKR